MMGVFSFPSSLIELWELFYKCVIPILVLIAITRGDKNILMKQIFKEMNTLIKVLPLVLICLAKVAFLNP